MKPILKLLVFLILSSCAQPTDNGQEKAPQKGKTDSDIQSYPEDEVYPTMQAASIGSFEFIERVFHVSDRIGNNCQVHTDCDCCGGWLLLNRDSTFFFQDICDPETSLSFGKFYVSDSALILDYSGDVRTKMYNEETSAYLFVDTVFSKMTETFNANSCSSQLILVNKLNGRIITPSNSNYPERSKAIFKNFDLKLNKRQVPQ